jgi:hypothetical protein
MKWVGHVTCSTTLMSSPSRVPHSCRRWLCCCHVPRFATHQPCGPVACPHCATTGCVGLPSSGHSQPCSLGYQMRKLSYPMQVSTCVGPKKNPTNPSSLYTEPAHPSVASYGHLVEGHRDCVALWQQRGVSVRRNNDATWGGGGCRPNAERRRCALTSPPFLPIFFSFLIKSIVTHQIFVYAVGSFNFYTNYLILHY